MCYSRLSDFGFCISGLTVRWLSWDANLSNTTPHPDVQSQAISGGNVAWKRPGWQEWCMISPRKNKLLLADAYSHFLLLAFCLQHTWLKEASVRPYSSRGILIKTADISTSLSLWLGTTCAIFQVKVTYSDTHILSLRCHSVIMTEIFH